MKTITESAAAPGPEPGNLTTRQLATSLIRTGTAAGQEESTTAGAETAEETSREPSPDPEGERAEPAPESEATTEATETESSEQPEVTEPPTAEPEAAPEPAPEPEEGKGLPDEVREAIEIAKAQDGGKGKADLLKRVHKLVDQRDTERNARLAAEDASRQLRTELEEARKAKPDQAVKVAQHPEVARVAQELASVDHWLNWCDEHPDGGAVPDGKGGEVELDGRKVAGVRRDLERNRSELVARKVSTERDVNAAYQREYQRHHAEAVEKFPWLANSNSAEYQEAKAIVRAFPMIRQAPDFEKVLGWMFKGRAMDAAETQARKSAGARKPTPAREPTKVVTEPPAARATVERSEEKAAKEAESQFAKSGRVSDLAKTFTARARASRAK